MGAFWVERVMEESDLRTAQQAQREATFLEATTLRYRLEAETLSTFHLITGLRSYIARYPNLTQEDFNRLAESIYKAHKGLVNIAAAPDMVIRYVYPLEGNEAAVGLDYTTHPRQRVAALAVKESGEPVIAGPVNLVQGGTALIGRFPVYVNEEGEKRFWGIVSTPLDTRQLYEQTGLMDPNLSVIVGLRGKDGKGAIGEQFFGPDDLFQRDVLTMPVLIFSGQWELGVLPKAGWIEEAPNGLAIRLLTGTVYGLLVVLIVLINVYVVRLDRSRSKEMELSRAKSRFLAHMSHEVRTPLNGISGVAQLLRRSDLDDDQTGLADIIVSSVDSLNDLLNNILNLSKLESGRFHLNEEVIEFDPFIASFLNVIRIQAEQKQLDFRYSGVPADRRVIMADGTILRQILWNLLSNALKFTQSGSVRLDVLSIQMEESGLPGIQLVVTDTGIGIAKERQEAIFEGYIQEERGTGKQFGGTGLGLAIVKRLVEEVGGSIELESDKGRGSRFSVAFPVRLSLD